MANRSSGKGPLWGSLTTNGLGMFAAGLMIGAFPWFWFTQGGSALGAGIIAATFHTGIALGLFTGGRLIDKLGPRPVLLWTDFASAIAFAGAGLGYMWMEGSLWPVILFVSLGLLFGAPGNVAQDSRMPALARLACVQLGRANGLRDLASQVGQVTGPILGVLLVEFAGLQTVLLTVSLILLLVFLLDMVFFPAFRLTHDCQANSGGGSFAYLTGHSGLKTMIVLAILVIGALNAINDIIAPSLALLHDLGASGLSVFFAMLGCGLVTSQLSYIAIGFRFSARRLLLGGLTLAAIGLFCIGMPSVVGYYCGAVLLGFGLGPLWAIVLGAIQRTVPTVLRAGVIGLLGGIVLIVQPLVSVTVGTLVQTVGSSVAIIGFSLLVGFACLSAARSQSLAFMLDGKLSGKVSGKTIQTRKFDDPCETLKDAASVEQSFARVAKGAGRIH